MCRGHNFYLTTVVVVRASRSGERTPVMGNLVDEIIDFFDAASS